MADSIEATMHKKLADIAIHYREKHGVCIRYVEFNWLGTRVIETVPEYLMSVEVKTQAGAR